MKRIEVDFQPGGLGTTIQLICALLEFKEPVMWIVKNPVDSQKSAITQILKIFNVPEEQLKIEFSNDGSGTKSCDITKFFSPYLNVDSIFIKGVKEKIDTTSRKPYIGLCLYGGRGFFKDADKEITKSFPYIKMWPIETYSTIISKIIESGYEILTLDNVGISVEDKVHLMNNYCDAIIGYEGGMHHLAHLLKIPSIILPWNNTEKTSIEFIHSLHLDTRTYYVESIDEVENWNKVFLETLIGDLKHQRSFKNFWLGSPITFTKDLKKFCIHKSVDVYNYGSMLWFPTDELNLLKDNLKSITVGGLVPITYKE